MAQPLDYHAFADTRAWLGIPNFGDVASNAAFFVAGASGIVVTLRARTVFAEPFERVPYLVFFAGVLLTAFGSAYYHWAPDNERLVWDRLPMTIAFAGLIAAQLDERVSVGVGRAFLVPGVIVGFVSVIYWQLTERLGRGNVIPYAVVQGYAMVMIVALAAFCRSRYTRAADLFWVFFWYGLAKLMETFDGQVLRALGGTVSGHTLKHLAASGSGFVVARMLVARTLVAHPRSTP